MGLCVSEGDRQFGDEELGVGFLELSEPWIVVEDKPLLLLCDHH